MDSSSSAIVSAATALAQTQVQQQTGIAVLKTALDLQSTNAAALLRALPQPTAVASAQLGSMVDLYV